MDTALQCVCVCVCVRERERERERDQVARIQVLLTHLQFQGMSNRRYPHDCGPAKNVNSACSDH